MSGDGATPGGEVGLRFAGQAIRARAGVSLAAALLTAGERGWRQTRGGAARGLFCGMGTCQDCLVTVDGVSSQRACMTTVRDGMVVEPQPALPLAAAVTAVRREEELAPDVLVVGGGPAGLQACALLAKAGLDVVLVDEQARLGGQYYKQAHDGAVADRQAGDGLALIEQVRASGTRVLSGATVWGAFGPEEVTAGDGSCAWTIRPARLVLATGAVERPVPVPGWTLPGFLTTGAAQTLLRAYRVTPGRRVLVTGNGPLNLQVAAELVRAGAEVVALVELAAAPGPAQALDLLAMLRAVPGLVRDGLAYRAVLRRAGVPVLHGSAVIAAEGGTCVERAVVARIDAAGRPVPGSERGFAVDAVCAGYGFLPAGEIARALGCRQHFDRRRGQLVTERDQAGRTSLEGVRVIGDGGGLGGARVALAQGVLAAAAIIEELRGALPAAVEVEAVRAGRALDRAEAFQAALWRVYAAPRLTDQLAREDTVICRCEEVTLGQVRAAHEGGGLAIGALKRATRVGMGRCQGRYCAPLLAEIAARDEGAVLDESRFAAPRPPFRPLPIGAAAPGSATART